MKMIIGVGIFSFVLCLAFAEKAYSDVKIPKDALANVGDTVTYFFENFEDTANFAANGWYDNLNFITDTTEYYSSKRSAKFHWNSGAIFPDTGGTMRRKFTETDSLYISYWVKYGSTHVSGSHEFYIMTNEDDDYLGPSATHLTVYIEQNSRNPLIAINDALNMDLNQIGQDLTFVTENRAIAGGNGNGVDEYTAVNYYQLSGGYRNGKTWKDVNTTISKDVWHHIEVFLKLNSIVNDKGIGDGILQYWLDGEKLIDKNCVMFRTGQHPNMKFNQFLIGPYIGEPGSPVDQTFWVDDLLVGKIIADTPVTYSLAVNSGNGSGNYGEGAKVNISANEPPEGKIFDQWTGDVDGLLNVYSANTNITMPAGDVTITATYVDDISIQNLALNKSTTASDSGTTQYKMEFAVDDNTSSIWSVGGFPQWLEVDLGDIYTITSTELVCYQGRAYQFIVEAKIASDSNYVQLVDRSSNTVQGTASTPIKDNFTATKARYVRITVTGASVYTGSMVSLAEFRIFGTVITSINQIMYADAKIVVSPNPVSEIFTIAGEQYWNGKAKIELYSLSGDKIYESTGEMTLPCDINISSFKSGIYFIRILASDGKRYTRKIVKE